jgi:hypothetical protein
VKITVIATGFDRPSSSHAMASSAAQTPVDLQSYAAWKQDTGERAVAAGGGGGRLTFSRRAVLDLPLPAATADDMGPGAEFEPASPLDVPAFLRRQSEN